MGSSTRAHGSVISSPSRLSVRGSPSADVAQLAEQLFRKQQVKGSNPFVGSPKKPTPTRKTMLAVLAGIGVSGVKVASRLHLSQPGLHVRPEQRPVDAFSGFPLHAGEHVRVGVERDRDTGVSHSAAPSRGNERLGFAGVTDLG